MLALLAACSKSPGESSVLQASDLQGNGASFSANEIVDSASFQDQGALDEATILAFLQKTPYGSPSFLATYASHGVSAAEAIATASQRYALNPLVFLVRAQMDDGLVGSTTYPSPAMRVEYAFGCGCIAPGECDATYGGFDVQVDCLGAALRESLDAVAASGKTDGGWGPGVTSSTLDGVAVTPKDDSTSALYQYTPIVAVGQAGGNWLFWNLWRKYAAFAGYGGAKGAPQGAWIGDACTASSACVYGGKAGTCATTFPGGICTLACTGSCPTAAGEAATFCASFSSQGNFCLAVCNPADPQCRTGYGCKNVAQAGGTGTSAYVCFPE
ncbi:MAG TPA: hypothetical protein VF765_06825 [Polyangiaceae bacterium]